MWCIVLFWSQKFFITTFLKLNDINLAYSTLAERLEGHLDENTKLKLVIPTAVQGMLNKTNSFFNKTVKTMLKETYGNIEILAVPQLNGADGGENAFYLMVDEDLNGSFIQGQFFQQKMLLLGMMRKTKGFEEDFSNATAGCFVAQPLAIYRGSGI